MIILDTNVVSEPMRANGNPAVQAWLDRQVAGTLYLTVTSLSELLVAIAAVHGFTVATRDTAPFIAAGVPVTNPWEEG